MPSVLIKLLPILLGLSNHAPIVNNIYCIYWLRQKKFYGLGPRSQSSTLASLILFAALAATSPFASPTTTTRSTSWRREKSWSRLSPLGTSWWTPSSSRREPRSRKRLFPSAIGSWPIQIRDRRRRTARTKSQTRSTSPRMTSSKRAVTSLRLAGKRLAVSYLTMQLTTTTGARFQASSGRCRRTGTLTTTTAGSTSSGAFRSTIIVIAFATLRIVSWPERHSTWRRSPSGRRPRCRTPRRSFRTLLTARPRRGRLKALIRSEKYPILVCYTACVWLTGSAAAYGRWRVVSKW